MQLPRCCHIIPDYTTHSYTSPINYSQHHSVPNMAYVLRAFQNRYTSQQKCSVIRRDGTSCLATWYMSLHPRIFTHFYHILLYSCKIQDSRFKMFIVQNTKYVHGTFYSIQTILLTKNIIAISLKQYKLDINTLTYSASLAKSSSLQLLNNANNLNTDTGLL